MIKLAFMRGENLDEEIACLVLDVAFPGSQIDFSSLELIIVPDGKNPAQVRDAISKIPGMLHVQWLEGGEAPGVSRLSWDSD